ncbi:hypothetical protein RHSIM_Rhsim03G0040200 [Rhododendron simsii]|uniref:Uncharacterized protein n=1 Tax=Rhododendron simsii TaxID=118357 RepID=A0A834H7N3_RHOSS|nr:hypothetical protein RHSIM_Rhsim03G0040200 [Rhododendron simsii]
MAEALALTCLEKIVDCLVDPIKRQFTYMCCFNGNITELETQLKYLETTRQAVQMGANENRRKVRVVGPNVEAWLTLANEVTTEVEGIIQGKDKVKEGCLNGWCPNLKQRYSLSRKAVKKTKVVIDLKVDGVQYTQSSYSPPPACLEIITNRDFMGFESRRLIMEEIIKALKHDEINLIGVCGMGGVGKTTMVNEVATRAKDDNLFDEFPIAVVSQEPNLTNVQACIADTLGLKNIRDLESPIARADLLRKRLLQDNKKVLVILDDVWAEFDLKAMGIPLEGADKNFKVLYTSRNRDLWHDLRSKKEIPLKILSKDEAWQLFREKAGDSADAPDLQPIAKQIVDGCGCLPLALVLIGSALSKKSGRNYIKEIWKGMLDQLTCAGSTPADKDLYSRLALSYEYLEDEQAKHLFLLCCLYQEDEDISIEDLARYGLGLSLFDAINEMEKVRRRVFLIVDDLKSRYLLLDSENEEECVKVHDVVRDMGISIASKNKFALVIHGEVSEWPKKDTYEHYTSISLISRIITELPKGLTCPNLEFLLLDCKELEELPCNFFEGMGKLKVLVLKNFMGILSLPSSLRNLHTLSLSNFNGKLDNVSEFGGLFNLKTLSIRRSQMKELPEAIGELVSLRLLDLTHTTLERIPPGVISRLVRLEELYVLSGESIWEGEGKEDEGRNANLRELEFLSNLNTLEICIRSDGHIPKVPIFSKLKIHKVAIFGDDSNSDSDSDSDSDDDNIAIDKNLYCKCKRLLVVRSSIPIPSNRGVIDSLLRSSDFLVLQEKGCNDLVQALLLRDEVDGLQQLKLLKIKRCNTPECLADTMNPVHLPIAYAPAIFPILEELHLLELVKLREICRGPVPARSFGELTSIGIHNCERLRNLFQLPIVGCLPQLKRLIISSCGMMEEVFWKDQQEDVHAATNRIEFPKLEVLKLVKLPSLVGFCRGIDQIDFPQLKELYLEDIPQVNLLFHNNGNLSSNSKRNDNFGFLSLFPEKVSLPNLEVLDVKKLENLERLGHGPLSVGTLSKLKQFSVQSCHKLLCVIPSQFLPMLRELQKLTVESCNSLEVVFELEGLESNEPNPEIENLESLGHRPLSVGTLSKLKQFSVSSCHKLLCVIPSQFLPMLRELQELTVEYCDSLEVVFELEGLESNEPNPEILSPLKFVKLCLLPKLNCISKRYPVGIKYIQTLEIQYCNSLRYVFAPTRTKSIPQLRELKVSSCEMLSRIVAEENGLGESSVDEIEFPQLKSLKLLDLPKLLSFFPNVNVNTTTLAKSTDHYHNPLQPQTLFNEKVAIPSLEYLGLSGLQNVSDLWSSELPTSSFSKLKTLNVSGFMNLRSTFPLSIVEGLANLSELVIADCSKMEVVVYWEEEIEDGQGRKVEKTLFPLLRKLQLKNLPNLVSFFPNVNTTSLAKSNDHLYNPMRPQPLFNEKVTFPCLKYLGLSGLQNVSDLWGSELPTSSFSKLENLQVTDPASLKDKVCVVWIGDLNNTTQDLQEVARLLYTDYGHDNGVLALGSNGTMTMWKWDHSLHNLIGQVISSLELLFLKATSVLPSSCLAMTNDVTGVNLDEAVPCMALAKDDFRRYVISACGGKVSLYTRILHRVEKTFMPPPPASTFLAFHPQNNEIIAIGMEDSTIRIYNYWEDEVKSELKGHEKRITGLAFSTNLNILVSSAADAQLCIWRIDTWEQLKSVSIPLPAGKACNGDTRVQFHSDQIRLLVSHETQLAIYDASEMDRIRQWVPQDVLPTPISFAVYSCDSQLVYTSFSDGNIGVFDADSLTLACRIVPSIYLSPAMLSGGQAVYPRVVAAHPQKPNQFAIGLTNGFVVLMEPQESEGKWGLSPSTVDNGMLNDRTASFSNTSNHTPDQTQFKSFLSPFITALCVELGVLEREKSTNGDGPMARSMEKPKTLDDVTDKSKPWKVAETQCQLVVMPDSTDEAHKVARLLYRNGCEVLALGCNGALRLWRRYSSINNQSGKVTASVFPLQWQPASGLAMTNDVTGVNLEEAVPCMALSNNDNYIILACGGAISLFDARTLEVMKMFMSPPPSSTTFLAFHPQDNIIAVGMEDSTIRIYSHLGHVAHQVGSELKGHEKRITGLVFSTKLKRLVSSGADAQLCFWSIDKFEHLKSVPIQLPAGKACNGDTRVQFHSDQIRLLVSHETQLVIYDASKMDHIRQWVPQDVLPAPISFAAYSCDGQLVYTSFCDGNIGVFDADSLTLTCYISPSAYFPTLSSGSQALYPTVVATHPWKPNQFAIGLTNGSVILIEPPKSEGKWGLSPTVYLKGMLNDRIVSSSNTSNHKLDQEEEVDVDKKLEVDLGMDKDVDVDVDVDVDEDEEDQEEKRKKKEKGKAPQSE